MSYASPSLASPSAADDLEQRISRIVLEYAQQGSPSLPLDKSLDLRTDLGVESLSLVSLAVRLGEEFGVDIADTELDFGGLRTVGDLIQLGRKLEQGTAAAAGGKV